MDIFVRFTKGYQLGHNKFKKGDYALLTLADVKKKTAYVYLNAAEVKVSLDELFDAIVVLA